MFKKSSRIKLLYGSLLGLIVGILLLNLFIFAQFSPVSPQNTQTESFVIPKGQAISIIGQRLVDAGLIKNKWAFRFVVIKDGLSKKIQSGSFQVSPSMSTAQIAKLFTEGTDDVWLTIPEGWRNEEIADYLDRQNLKNFDKTEFLNLVALDQGKLFPDTYLIPLEFSTQQIYSLLINTFNKNITDLQPEIDASSHTLNEVLTMASLLEREAQGYEQMRQVAGVLWNRHELGMALQLDATLQYIEGYNLAQNSWWEPPLIATKNSTSPYNTYKYPGLPPGPIANPGAQAIKAAVNPASHDYLYYIHDLDGKIHFSRTLQEHNLNVSRYLR